MGGMEQAHAHGVVDARGDVDVRDATRGSQRFGPAVQRPCVRPDCGTSAVATLWFTYAEREVVVTDLTVTARPHGYDLCVHHADRTRPPRGWQLWDRRSDDDRRRNDGPQPSSTLGDDRTVAVLAAALRAVPDTVSEDAVRDRAAPPRPGPATGSAVPTQPEPDRWTGAGPAARW